ncbi:MAG: DNA topoisomerase IV subunit B, partial [Anaerolineae bacterium]|nr:DNA topoisomerase IV subunit B [Anaerolineae bacterium]
FVRYLNRGRSVIHPVVYALSEIDGTQVEAAWQYTDSFADNTYAFANTIVTPDGGVHLTGFRSALTRVINDYARKQGLLKDSDSNFSGDDTREGITAVISVKVPDPQFESQTKVKLLNVEVRNHVDSAVADAFSAWLDENPRDARAIVEKCSTAARARRAAKQARELVIRKSALESSALPGKLADCSTRNKDEA